jgi:anti-sigma regulatory factor (Ser/Thr protein kinase)
VSDHSFALPPAPTSPREARELAARELEGWGDPDTRHAVILLISELVTNAVVHARSTVTVDVAVRDDGPVHVTVHDESSVRPTPRRHHADLPGGRGMHLLESLAARWGVEDSRTGKSIWFEVDRLRPS